MSLIDYSAHDLIPRKLTKEETQDPYSVISSFFDYAHLPHIREMLWNWLKTTVTENWHTLSGKERSDALYFYEKLEKLVEAVHLINKNKSNSHS
jgi:hypothetical protein